MKAELVYTAGDARHNQPLTISVNIRGRLNLAFLQPGPDPRWKSLLGRSSVRTVALTELQYCVGKVPA
jgi:hypothetical protein